MSETHTIEAACWRIWYRLRERGPTSKENLMANCGVDSAAFERAWDMLENIGMVDKDAEQCALAVNEPRMMQTFPTIYEGEL